MQKQATFLGNEPEEQNINIREILYKYIYFWKWYVVSIALFLGGAYTYLRYSTPIYESKGQVLIKDEEQSGSLDASSILSEIGLSSGKANIENETAIFKSRTILTQVAEKLVLQMSWNLIGDKTGLIRGEIIEKKPLSVVFEACDSIVQRKDGIFEVQILNDSIFAFSDEKFEGEKVFNTFFTSSLGRIKIQKTAFFNASWKDKELNFSIIPLEQIVSVMEESLEIESTGKESDVIVLKLKGSNYQKNNAIIDEVIKQHQLDAIQDKNEVARNTSSFIEERMRFITQELSEVENESERYKTKYNLVDISSDASKYLEKESQTDGAITKATIQESISTYVVNYLKNNPGNEKLLPTNLGLEDPSIAAAIDQYNNFLLMKNKLLLSSSTMNPSVVSLEGQLNNIKSSLKVSLQANKDAIALELRTLRIKENTYQAKIGAIPKFEREFREIFRQQQIKETLYLFLMQKREENEIQLAATIDNTKVIDYAFCNKKPIAPNKGLVYVGALFIGLFLPLGIVFLRDVFDNKVHDLKDLEPYNLQGLGEIPLTDLDKQLITEKGSKTGVSESFRMLRSNLNFLLDKQKKSQVLIITSTISGEGKSFSSINLAHSLGFSEKKTVLVDFDLRAASIEKSLNLKAQKGLTDYIIQEDVSIDDLLILSTENEHVHYICSGSLPPNPAELLMRKRVGELIEGLRERFDYIVIDSAPVGLVSDTLNITDYADLVIYIVRADKLEKSMLALPQKLEQNKQTQKLGVIINGVSQNKPGYGYGYGEYFNEKDKKNKSFVRKLRTVFVGSFRGTRKR